MNPTSGGLEAPFTWLGGWSRELPLPPYRQRKESSPHSHFFHWVLHRNLFLFYKLRVGLIPLFLALLSWSFGVYLAPLRGVYAYHCPQLGAPIKTLKTVGKHPIPYPVIFYAIALLEFPSYGTLRFFQLFYCSQYCYGGCPSVSPHHIRLYISLDYIYISIYRLDLIGHTDSSSTKQAVRTQSQFLVINTTKF